ncbi:class I SAM-dependent methyltransferase [Oceanibacterium hippocampi]|uniref:Demethylrebeccamycin-D-glucose O-methyltransferase n=1 Tax=Oceanibacterium hippocampi TaxID=745714 RepID=A0A1Y5S095_9PROT|nr:class I SAM-dependent methyltransferase [Oceanibacterium hippocampi]SLN29695.1 Demethylrebeccamycin-D-glucose O-methyltransferase [Oceanibacterium hippocampi]
MKRARPNSANSGPGIEDVRNFWNRNPLWTGESAFEPGTREFFEEHRQVYREDCFAGRMDETIFPPEPGKQRVLDLGCGVGFWLIEYWERGFRSLCGADLSARSLEVATRRCALYGVEAELVEQNAEALDFADGAFTHVNCQGVIHHTPHPERAIAEIHRVLAPGGTASISVYYRNVILRHYRLFLPLIRLVHRLGGALKGRGRETIFALDDADKVVRYYDGAENPIGYAYTVGMLRTLVHPFEIERVYFHFFPARALPFALPKFLHRLLDRRLPFMIYASLRKPTG